MTLHCYHPVASPTRVPSGSDVVHVDVLGSHIVILNSIKAANDLLDKRSSIYSDRYDTATGSRITRLCHLLIQHTSQTANGGPAKAVRQTGTFIQLSRSDPPSKDRNGIRHRLCAIWPHLAAPAPSIQHQFSPHRTRPVEQRAVYGLLRNLLASPDKFSQHLRQ